MAFSFYQSAAHRAAGAGRSRTHVRPVGLGAVLAHRGALRHPAPDLNMMMSMSGGWFFVTVSEAISVGQTNIALPGIGSWIAVCHRHKNLPAIFEAIAAMLVVILIYDQLLFRPLIAWPTASGSTMNNPKISRKSWALDVYRRSKLLDMMTAPFEQMMRWVLSLAAAQLWTARRYAGRVDSRVADILWYVLLGLLGSLRRMAHLQFRACQSQLVRPGDGGGAGLHHLDPGDGADRHRQRDLDAGRRLCGTTPQADPDRAAGGAIPGGIPQQPALSRWWWSLIVFLGAPIPTSGSRR